MSLSKVEIRYQEPIAALLRKQLRLPQIYFDQQWPPLGRKSLVANVLAIDDAGTADVHVVLIHQNAVDAFLAIPEIMNSDAHYRWIAFDESTVTKKIKQRIDSRKELDPTAGAGRIGVIAIKSTQDRTNAPELKAEIAVYPERFHGLKYSQVEAYLKNLEADMYTKV